MCDDGFTATSNNSVHQYDPALGLIVNYKGRSFCVRGLRAGGKDIVPEITNINVLIEDLRSLIGF